MRQLFSPRTARLRTILSVLIFVAVCAGAQNPTWARTEPARIVTVELGPAVGALKEVLQAGSRMGFFEGLQVNVRISEAPGLAVISGASGGDAVVGICDTPAYLAGAKAGKLTALGNVFARYPYRLLVSDGSSARSIGDLKGKYVATSVAYEKAKAFPVVAIADDFDPSSISRIETLDDERLFSDFSSGKVDAIGIFVPQAELQLQSLESRGSRYRWLEQPPAYSHFWVTRSEDTRKQPELLSAFFAGVFKTFKWASVETKSSVATQWPSFRPFLFDHSEPSEYFGFISPIALDHSVKPFGSTAVEIEQGYTNNVFGGSAEQFVSRALAEELLKAMSKQTKTLESIDGSLKEFVGKTNDRLSVIEAQLDAIAKFLKVSPLKK